MGISDRLRMVRSELPCLLQELAAYPGSAAAVGPHQAHNIHLGLRRFSHLHDINKLSRAGARMCYTLLAMQLLLEVVLGSSIPAVPIVPICH